jgi:hypothetical protein
MAINLLCVNPFHNYVKGQVVTDPVEIAKLSEDRDNHFVRISVPDPKPAAPDPKK